jgi:hypothetical protein
VSISKGKPVSQIDSESVAINVYSTDTRGILP